MSDNSPRFLHEYKDIYSGFLKRARALIVDGYWHIKENRLKFNLKEEDLKHTQAATEGVLEALEIFIDTAEEKDRSKPGVQPLINEILSTINIHLDRIEKYYGKNDPKGFKTKEDQRSEGKFQQLLFKSEQKVKSKIRSLNIENDMSDFQISFFNNAKATIPFKKVLCSRFPNIKAKVETLKVDWDLILDNELYVSKPPRDIPEWRHEKHFWDQEEDTLQFWISEFNKISKGITIDGVYFSPWMYYHINFFKTPIGDKQDEIVVPELRDNEWYLQEMLNHVQSEIDSGKDGGLAIMGTRRYGKALRNDEPLYYEDGERSIGEAKVGDRIYGADGELTNIVGVYPQGDVDLYRVSFGDGRNIISCDEHLWYVQTKSNKWMTLSLKEIKNRISKTNPFYIPLNQPINYTEKEFTLSPYFIGYGIGDGGFTEGVDISFDPKDEEELREYLNSDFKKYSCEVKKVQKSRWYISNRTKIKKEISKLNLNKPSWEKRIPKEYLKGSIEQRMNLLRGLLDSDGCCSLNRSGNGKIKSNISFTTVSKGLKDDIISLCRTLGIQISSHSRQRLRKGKICRVSYEVLLHTDLEVFKLKRKKDKIIKRIKGNPKRSPIVNIEYIGKDKATCIRVDNKDKLFITRDCVVTHNSTAEASWSCFKILTNPTKNGVISSSAEKDILALADKVDIGITNLPLAFQLPLNSKDWTKQVRFGLKTKSNQEIKYFYLDIVNIDSGSKRGSQKLAGIAPILFVMDEFAKEKFIDAYNALIPALETSNGWKTIPWFTATGGDEDLSAEADKALSDPTAHRLVPMNWDILNRMVPEKHRTWNEIPFGYFIPAQMGQRTGHRKVKKPLSEFLGIDSKFLDKVFIHSTDWEHNTKVCLKKREDLSRDKNQLQKEIVYYPLDPEECFMSAKQNPYPAQNIKKHKERIQSSGDKVYGTARKIKLMRSYEDSDKIEMELDSHREVNAYPHNGSFIDCPFLLYDDFPEERPSDPYRYVAGLDDYKQDESEASKKASIGAFYIFDRLKRKIVLGLATRPDPHTDFHKQMHMALDAWNAKCFMENADMDFKKYLDRLTVKTADMYLHKGFDAYDDFSKFQNGSRKFGWRPDKNTVPIVRGYTIDYTRDDVDYFDDNGNITHTVSGFERIEDVQLLEEMIKFKPDGNFDRLVAFGSCLAIDYYMSSNYMTPRLPSQNKPVLQENYEPPTRNKFFTKKRRSFFSR